ncbi:MAG: hypothetical protein WCG42_06060 [Parachlamydiaceae bacterium]
MSVNTNFIDSLGTFCNNNKTLCILTLGLAIVGFKLGTLGGRCVSWLSKVCGRTEKADSIAQEKFDTLLSKEHFSKNDISKNIQKIESSSGEESLTIHKSLSILSSAPKIKTCVTVELPNFTSVHINKQGEVFYLTPIGGSKYMFTGA